MKIKSIKLNADKTYNFELNDHVTLITDISGGGKTLLFKLIEFVLGSSGNNIDIDEANKIYPGLKNIELSIVKEGKEYTFISCFDFKTRKVFCNGNELDGEYVKSLNKLINYNPVKVIKNKKKMESTTFTLREYIKILFFNEHRLTSSDSLLTNDYTSQLKTKNFYKYLVVGKTINNENVEKAKKEIETFDAVEHSFKVIKEQIQLPTKEEKKIYNYLASSIKKTKNNIAIIEVNIKEIERQKNLKIINIQRMKSLCELFGSRIEDFKSAIQFEDYMKGYYFTCQCGEKIFPINSNIDHSELIRLDNKKRDIEEQIKINLKEIENLNVKIEKEKNKLKEEKEKVQSLTEQSEIIEGKIKDFVAYEKLSKIFELKKKDELTAQAITDEEHKIDETFCNKINIICDLATCRLKKWGIPKYYSVSFDDELFDFRFDGTLRSHLAKGYKNICTFAAILEILKNSIGLGINLLETLMIDTIWSQLFIENKETDLIIENIIKDIADENIQFIIMENKIPSSSIDGLSVYNLKELK